MASGTWGDADNNNIAKVAPKKSDPGTSSGVSWLTRNICIEMYELLRNTKLAGGKKIVEGNGPGSFTEFHPWKCIKNYLLKCGCHFWTINFSFFTCAELFSVRKIHNNNWPKMDKKGKGVSISTVTQNEKTFDVWSAPLTRHSWLLLLLITPKSYFD